MKRGIGIKYQTEWLEPDKLGEWLFDNLGEPNTRTKDGSLIACDHEKGVYFTYSAVNKVLRISLWTDMELKDAWNVINGWAQKVGLALQCNLTSYMTDLYEYDEETKGYKCKYDGLVSGELERHVVVPQETTKKVGNC